MTAKLKTPLESLIMRLFQRTVSSLLFDFLNNKQFPYMCIYMNMNVESHLPLAKNLLHLYLYCVCPFSQIRSSISSYRVSCELKLCPRPHSWQSDYSHLNRNLCFFSSLNCTREKKNDGGITSNLKKWCFVPNSKLLMLFRRLMVQVSIGNRNGTYWQTACQDTIPLWKVSRRKSRETRDQMRATRSNEQYRIMPGHTTSQSAL